MPRLPLLFLFPLLAASQTAQITEQLGRTILYSDVAISPDGTRVAWAQTTAASAAAITYIAPTAAQSRATRVETRTAGRRIDSAPAWSPDSKTLAFLSTSGEANDQVQIWTVDADGANPRKRTHLRGYAGTPRWSPDGKQIAFLYIEGAAGGGPLLAAPAMTGVIDTAFHNQRIATLDLAAGKVRQVSPPDLHIYDYDWSPDGRRFAVTAAPGPGDNNWWIAQIYSIALDTGKASSIYKPALQVAIPRWSPDGKTIAIIEGLMSDEGFHGGDVFTVGTNGGAAINRTNGRRASASSLFWLAPDRLLLTERVGGGSTISELTLPGNAVKVLWQGDEKLYAFGNFLNFAVSRDAKTTAVARSSFERAPEIFVGPVGQWRQLTSQNDSQSPAWGKSESLQWTNEGLNIQGWLLPPKQIEPGRQYPMIVMIHGGPSSAVNPEWPGRNSLAEILASQGYYVLMPNPRGSYGQGEDFTKANVKDFGAGDLRDILKGVDVALANHPIDPQRLGVTGWSYGGYMTMWTVTQTNRFRAAMAGAGIANWQSYYGQNLIDQWMIPFFGASVYDDPAVYEKSSPMHFIKKVKTPTLVIVGERDAECPAPQSFEFWHALRSQGVPTQLIVYAGEGHMLVNPKNRVDMQDQTVSWFNKYLKN
jgi:dipeptidyl aminopeptidase/acylaminoacyl peptidase